MPRVKSANSLVEICIDSILENQKIFCERFKTKIVELEDGVDALDSDKPAVNPFDELPDELLQELRKLFRKKETSTENLKGYYGYPRDKIKITPFLKLLITPRLRTLDLTIIEEGSDISDILHLATIRSPNLETLRLDSSSQQHLKSLYFIPKFVKLRILEIPFPDTGDECFDIIGKHCPDLRELTCVECIDVTDDGIRKLCVDGNCKSIHLLSIKGCRKVTTKGIQMALDNLPHLRILRHESLVECLAEIAETAINQKLNLPKFSLTALEISSETVYKSGSLRQSVLRLCPNVTEVYLSMSRKEGRLKHIDLLSLLSLEKLYTIEIGYCTYDYLSEAETPAELQFKGLSFDCVVPLLKQFGWCINRLKFSGFWVDIAAIIKFCPNLECLFLSNCQANQSTETKVDWPVLQNLKRLYIFSYSTTSSENLFALFSSPSLSYINMSACDALTDNVLQRAAKIHSFRNLKYLDLSCSSVSKHGIDIFLQESNPLERIELYWSNSTSAITREDINNWNDNAIWIKKNWQFKMSLHYSGRSGIQIVRLGGAKNIWGGAV